ncbi:MAG TPA: inorganic diphosphatase [Acidimicrobiales bacterium]
MARDLNEGDIVVVEVPGGSRNKYETDPVTGVLFLDRTLFTATRYPADYGYFPDTLAEDGDELDALVLVSEPTFPGCRVYVRPIGVLWMHDEKGEDAKVICIALDDPDFGGATSLEDINPLRRAEIEHFFSIYKELEPDKSSEVTGWSDADEARKAVADAAAKFREQQRQKPPNN